MNTTKTTMHEISLPLDERNLAHVLSALSLAGIADEKMPCEMSRCWWAEDTFWLRLPGTRKGLFEDGHQFLKTIRWTMGNLKLMIRSGRWLTSGIYPLPTATDLVILTMWILFSVETS